MVQYFSDYADHIAIVNAHLICILLDISRLDLFLEMLLSYWQVG
jgi:hypothetical protein